MVLKVPGMVIERQIGGGGTATVYLGAPADSADPVAVKVLAPQYPPESPVGQRFLAGCAIQQRVVHANVEQLIRFGSADGQCYVVTEFLPGGDLKTRLRRGLHLQALLKIIKDIARALDAVHAKHAVHGDVKPENILFGSDGRARLCDFGVARSFHPESVGGRGMVLGTPEYIAPEQAAGRQTDGRADLYSLGAVLYHMLAGDLPYRADTAVSLGIKHLQEPIPRLPAHLQSLQPIIDKAMAKRREQRFQSGEAMVAALDEFRQDTALPDSTIKTNPINTQEIRAIGGGDLLTTPRDPGRQERLNRRARRQRVMRTGLLTILLIGVTGSAGYYVVQEGLVSLDQVLSELGIGEDPQLVAAWNEAQSLRQDPNQGLAAIVAAYRRVLTLAPDHAGALAEVAGLANDWKKSINEALLANNLQFAETRLVEAGPVFPNDLEWVQLNTRLQNRQRAERIMQNTEALLRSHGLSDLPSATAAIQSYQEVLRLAPNHAGAIAALSELAVHYADMARLAVDDGEVTSAISLLERATAADRSLASLDDVRKLISQATTARAAIDSLLQQARRYRAQNQLIRPPGENAAELYHRVLATDPDNVIAAQGLDEITSQIAANSDQLLAEGRLDEADVLVNQASAAGLAAEAVNEIRRRVDAERVRLATISDNLQAAQRLIADGYLTAPLGNNAVAKLREIQQINPGNPQAQELLRLCAERLANVATEAHQFGMPAQAKQYLDLALTITPEVQAWVALRDSWERE